jgi:hypothetical protein
MIKPGQSTPVLDKMLNIYSNGTLLPKLVFISAGWKSCKTAYPGQDENDIKQSLLMPKADLYLDCRVIPNPTFISGIGATGDDPRMQEWVEENAQAYVKSFSQLIIDGLQQVPSRRKGKDNPWEAPYIICTMCAHGIHRSRSMKHILARKMRAGGWNVEIK